MALTASPYGLRPVQLLGGLPFAGAIRSYLLSANTNKPFYFGDPVGLSGGNPTALVASPTTAISANSPIGVFMGAEWQDPVRGFVNSQWFPANGILSGATQVRFKILDFPGVIWKIQASGPVTVDKVGMNVQLLGSSIGTGNSATGDSSVAADAAAAVTATYALRIVGFPNQPNSLIGDAFTDLLVVWNQGVHRFQNPTG